jgi:hypothetical protein
MTNCFKKKAFLNFILSFILLGLFLTSLPQTQALKSQPAPKRDTLVSPNPVEYVPYWVSGGQYGRTVACGGNYIFVHGEGNFYVYNAFGKVLVKTIVGSTIAIGSEYVAIGDPDYSSRSGKVDVYRLNNLNKIATTLTAPEEYHVGFGLSIAINDDKMLISDIGAYSGEYPYSGDVYIYSLPSFSYITKLEQMNPERAFGSPFGSSVAFCGNHIVVGAPDQTVNGAIFAGNVYLYSSETYALEKTIPDPQAIAETTPWGGFGESIAVAGDNIWISEKGFVYPGLGIGGEIRWAGKVYCYNPNGGQVRTLTSQNPSLNGLFGQSLAANDDYVIVGASGESVDVTYGGESTTIPQAGQVYVFTASGTYTRTLISLNPQVFGFFGFSVDFGSGYYVVGARDENATVRYRSTIQTYNRAGVAYILS